MASIQVTHPMGVSVPLPAHLRRLYRAFVTPQRSGLPERTFFVEAGSHQAAARKIAGTVAALEYTKPYEAEQAVYNVASACEHVHDGVSLDIEARIWECGWSGRNVCSWVTHPVFLVADPLPLLLTWGRVLGGAQS